MSNGGGRGEVSSFTARNDNTDRQSLLTHQVLVVIVIRVVYDAMAVSLVEPAEPAYAEPFAVNGRPALEAHLAQTLVQTLAQRSSGDLRMELAA